jgi:hypothetical protein
MAIGGSSVVVIALVALVVSAILVATILLVAQFTAMRSKKMSRFLFFLLLFILGNPLKNASRFVFVGYLTLLTESDELEQSVGTILFKSANLH